jgi:protein-tyrosine phosphatase
VLFLCTGNYYRSRFAEIVFNSVAARMQLPWRATSRGLALERGVENIGPMSKSAIKAVEDLGIRAPSEIARSPATALGTDFETAHWIVALKESEHLPLLQERFPAWVERVEFWQVDDAPRAPLEIEGEVMDLAARLIAGGRRRAATETSSARAEQSPAAPRPTGKLRTAKVGRETAGRRGKSVTTVFDLSLTEDELQELAATLKQRCGTGGTAKNGRIEIQGDQRDRIVVVLEQLGYKVTKV